MGRFVKGEVVVIPFPFSDLSDAKRRPAMIVSVLEGDDVLLCQITSQAVVDKYSIPLADPDFSAGNLSKPSNIRPNRLFTADSGIILYSAGRIKTEKITEVISKIVEIIRS